MPTPEMMRVLLIDDDELSRAVLELHLSGAGFAVIDAEDGDSALRLLREGPAPAVDVILSDLQMPGLSGPELARALRSAGGPTVRLIAMSGSRPAPERLENFDDFLLKPFSPEQFAASLRGPEGGKPHALADPRKVEAPVVLEETTYAQISGMLRPPELGELLRLAFSELERQLTRMHAAWETGDRTGLRESAHAMKGSFGLLGARELQGLAAELESGTGSAADQAATLSKIPDAADRLKGMLTSRGLELAHATLLGQETR